MSEPADGELAIVAGRAWPVGQVRAFVGWVGQGRALTQTGRVRLADARELVGLLDTGDLMESRETGWRVSSSVELPRLTAIVQWAKESRLVRVSRGRLVPVKKSAALLDRPLELWARMLGAFPRLGTALCQPGWAQSPLRDLFQETMEALFEDLRDRGGSIDIARACALAWEMVTACYVLEDASEQQLTLWRGLNDRDVREALGVLELFGALRRSGERVTLTELGSWGMRGAAGEAGQRGRVLQVKVRYEDLRAVLADPAHEQHEEMLEWLGVQTATEFDPARFDAGRSTGRSAAAWMHGGGRCTASRVCEQRPTGGRRRRVDRAVVQVGERRAAASSRKRSALSSDELNGRAGRQRWGYVEPTEAAWQLLEETAGSHEREIERLLALGIFGPVVETALGLVAGLYRCQGCEDGDLLLSWAPDFPLEHASWVVDKLAKAGVEFPPELLADAAPGWVDSFSYRRRSSA